jgi:hypothetical protein
LQQQANMKKALYTLIALLALSTFTHAQNVGVNTDGSDPDSDALLHVNRTTGVAIDSALIRIENEENTTANHVTGLEFINSATGPTSTWRFYNPGLGSTDFRINNNGNDYMTILNSGNVGVGTTTPNGILHVENPLTSTNTSEELIVGGGAPHIVIQDLNGSGGLMSSQFLFTDETNAIHAGMGWGDLGATSNITFFRIESSTDDMRLRTAAGDVMSLTTAGLVGIGTTTPDHELHIVSPATGGGGNGPLRLTGRADKDNHIRYDYPSDNTSFWLLGVEFNRGVNNFSLWNNNRGVFDIAVEESTGYVGIGTTTPGAKLEVYDMVASPLSLRIFNPWDSDPGHDVYTEYGVKSTGVNPDFSWSTGIDASDDEKFKFSYATSVWAAPGTGDVMTLTMDGNVGIGTSAPIGPLHVYTTPAADLELTSNNGLTLQGGDFAAGYASLFMFGDGNDQKLYIRAKENGGTTVTQFTDCANNAAIILNDLGGNVGIGTATPEATLDVQGPFGSQMYIGSTGNAGLIKFRRGTNGALTGSVGYSSAGDGTTFEIKSTSGGGELILETNPGAGTTGGVTIQESNGDINMEVRNNGTLYLPQYGPGSLEVDATGLVRITSDERLKHIQGNFTRGLADIKNISPITYKWRPSAGGDTINNYSGFSAQNIQANIPEATGENAEGYLTMSDRPILAALVNAVNEQQAIIEALKTENESLKTEASNSSAATNQRLEDLEAKINALLNAQAVTVQK